MIRKHSVSVGAASLAVSALLLSGCQSLGPTDSADLVLPGTVQPTTGVDGPCPDTDKDEYTIAVIRWAPQDVFFNGVQLGQRLERDRIQEQCGVDIRWRLFGSNDASEQLKALQSFIEAGVDGVDLVPAEGAAFTSILNDLHEEGVPVVTHDISVPGAPQTFVSFDNVEAGAAAGQAVVKKLDELRGTEWRQEEGVFIELRCIISADFDIARHTGFRQSVDPVVDASGGQISVASQEVGCDNSQARTATDDIISRFGGDKVLGVLAVDGDSALGALSALTTRDLIVAQDDAAYVPVVAIDASAPELVAIADGRMLMSAEQPGLASGMIAQRLMFEMLASGELIEAPAADSEYALPDFDGAPWLPITITTNDLFDGAWYQTRAFNASDIPFDSQWHWANALAFFENGSWPTYE